MSSRKGTILSSKVLDTLNSILAAHTRKTLMEPLLQTPEGMSTRSLNLMKGCSRRNQESSDHHLKEEIILNLIHLNFVMNIKPISFKTQPRKGNPDRAKRIVGYLLFLPDGTIRFRTEEPDLSSLKDQVYDWTRSVYSGTCEQIPHDIPKPLGKHGQTTHYVDANLHNDLATGKVVTAVLHFLNQTPIDAYSKGHHLVSYH